MKPPKRIWAWNYAEPDAKAGGPPVRRAQGAWDTRLSERSKSDEEYIRADAVDSELRAEADRLRAALQSIVEAHAMASELYESDAEMAANFRDRAQGALDGWDARWGLEQMQAWRAQRMEPR